MIDGSELGRPGRVDGVDGSPIRLVDHLHDHAMRTPEAEAVVSEGHRLTYRELEGQVVALARALLAWGIRRGDTVAVLSTPRADFWVTFLATTAIGAVWVGVNPKFTLREARHVIADAQPRLLFAISEFDGRPVGDMVATLRSEHESLEEVVWLTGERQEGQPYAKFLRLADECAELDYRTAVEVVDRDDPALLVYTSGTSGKPKGALLSHHGLAFGASVQVRHYAVARLNTMCSFPINHVSSVADVCSVALVAGGTVHFQERFDPGKVLECIQAEGITLWLAVPTMFLLVLDHARAQHTDFSRLELAVCGGAALSEFGMKRLRQLVPNVMNAYGMTETAANIVFTDREAGLEELCNTVGRPSPQVECRIVDDDEDVCGPDEVGELQFRADFMFLGYLQRPAVSREAYTADGWLRTGDLAYMRDDGNITLVGRKSETYKSGGYNVYPREVELVLERHPSVEMAAVVATPDDLYQEVGAAYIIPTSGAADTAVDLTQELKGFCAQHLANYKVPKRFTISREVPTLAVGKIDKAELRRRISGQVRS